MGFKFKVSLGRYSDWSSHIVSIGPHTHVAKPVLCISARESSFMTSLRLEKGGSFAKI